MAEFSEPSHAHDINNTDNMLMPQPILKAWDCPLLQLPGELRNHIYNYCVEDEPVKPRPTDLDQQNQQQVGVYLGLTQVCRKIRAEYRPLYLSHVTHDFDSPSTCIDYMTNLLQAQPVSTNGPGGPSRYIGNVIINFQILEDHESAIVEVEPLFQFIARFRGIRVFSYVKAHGKVRVPMIHLDRLLQSISEESSYRSWVSNLVACDLTVDRFSDEMDIHMHEDNQDEWQPLLLKWWQEAKRCPRPAVKHLAFWSWKGPQVTSRRDLLGGDCSGHSTWVCG
ncbi:hypothetical protein NX059_012090 [Plenodomus lindquistii]|nr:hypothetical protein NX059_012090 [Plenodomus lindquistii]